MAEVVADNSGNVAVDWQGVAALAAGEVDFYGDSAATKVIELSERTT